jgi:hypothetical protein
MRINETDTVSQGYVHNQIVQKRCFSGSGLSDDVDVLALVTDRYAKGLGVAPAESLPNCDGWLIIHGSKTSRHSCRREEPPSCVAPHKWPSLEMRKQTV